MTATKGTALRARSMERYEPGDRVIDYGNIATTVLCVDYNPHRCAGVGMCGRRDCGRYYLTSRPGTPVRACSLRRMLAVGETLAFRVGEYLISVQCIRLDESYHVTVSHGEAVVVPLADYDSAWTTEPAARDMARQHARWFIREMA